MSSPERGVGEANRVDENNRLFEQVMRLSGGLNGSHSRDEVKDSATFAVRTLEGTIAELRRGEYISIHLSP